MFTVLDQLMQINLPHTLLLPIALFRVLLLAHCRQALRVIIEFLSLCLRIGKSVGVVALTAITLLDCGAHCVTVPHA